jgi:hypothetical protein
MRANKKKANRQSVVLFTLFIFVKKKKNNQHSGTHLKKTFAHFCLFQKFLTWERFRELGYQVGDSGKCFILF